jgi:AraC family ethanolamine operon transcriptional activator
MATLYDTQRFDDAADCGRAFAGWRLECQQLSAGRFEGEIVQLSLDGLQIIREVSNRTLLKRGECWQGAVVLSVPVEATGHGWLGGRPLVFPAPLLTGGHDLPELVTPTRLDVISIAFDRDWLVARGVEIGSFRLADQIARRKSLILPQSRYALLSDTSCAVFAQLSLRPRLAEWPESRKALADAIVASLFKALEYGDHPHLFEDTPHKKTVDRVRALAFEDTSCPMTIGEICKQLGVSRRHLQNCFQASFGLSATQLLRRMRLNHVRRELRQPAREGYPVSIGDVAARWGFWHWSRFAAEYKHYFGELPSATVLRATGCLRK